MRHDRMHAVVEALNVHSNHAIKVFFGRALDRANVRNARVINQNVNALVPE